MIEDVLALSGTRLDPVVISAGIRAVARRIPPSAQRFNSLVKF
jgi:hypothetical protein